MSKKSKIALVVLLVLGATLVATLYLRSHNIAVLNPKGTIATKERSLMIYTVLLGFLVVIPVFVMTFFIVWKYRASNKRPKKYTPDWDHHLGLESLWWGIPCAIIVVLAVLTWTSSHELDPYKKLSSDKTPVTVQVVSLNWKWLFIYPKQNIATVNLLEIPVNTPVNFEITSDAPMNSFWIPQLGGQVYAMSGMSTQLHLMGDTIGSYAGSSSNISGKGFAGMRFTAKVTSQKDFDVWVRSVQDNHSNKHLSSSEYNRLARPSENNAKVYYSSVQDGLYNTVMDKYMSPAQQHTDTDMGMDKDMDMGHNEGMH